MPSPIAHVATGWLASRVATRRAPEEAARIGGPALAAWAVLLSLLPDLDAVPGILLGDLGRFHNNVSHSLFVGALAAVAFGALAAATRKARFGAAFALALGCYGLHVAMDWVTVGRGVMVLWPLTAERFSAPFPLFYGLRWSDGPISPRHLLTLASEIPFVLLVAYLGRRRVPPRATAEG